MTFKAARMDSQNLDWEVEREQHPDLDLRDLKTLRERSHQLIRDDLVTSGMQQAYINHIASTGPTIYSAGDNKIQREQINNYLKTRFEAIDPTGTKSIADLVEELVGCAFADGDIGINLPIVDGLTVVELVEAFRINSPVGKITDSLLRHGVQYDANGKIIGYHVLKSAGLYQFGYLKNEFEFFPTWVQFQEYARRVFYLFKAPSNSRPLASRQYPLSTPLMPVIKHLGDYQEAVIVGARVAACFAGYTETDNPAASTKSIANDADPGTGAPVAKIKPGTITNLKRGQKIAFSNPNRPSDNHDSYILRNHKTIAMAYRVPYIIAFQDTEQVTYSAYKGAFQDLAKLIGRWRRKLTEILLWITNTIILEGIANGEIRGSLSTAKIRVRWPSLGSLDTEKESRGNKIALVDNRTKSRQMICDEDNVDFEELEADLLEEELAEVERKAQVLVKKKEWEDKEGIIFPDTVQETDPEGRSTYRRPGEKEGEDLDPDDAKERRKSDGNW